MLHERQVAVTRLSFYVRHHNSPKKRKEIIMASFNIKTYTVNITNCATPYAYIMVFDANQASRATYRARLNFSQL